MLNNKEKKSKKSTFLFAILYLAIVGALRAMLPQKIFIIVAIVGSLIGIVGFIPTTEAVYGDKRTQKWH